MIDLFQRRQFMPVITEQIPAVSIMADVDSMIMIFRATVHGLCVIIATLL